MDDFVRSIGTLIDALRGGQALLITSAIVNVITQLLKKPWAGGIMEKLPRQIRPLVPVGLGLISGVATKMATGMPWYDAVAAGLGGGYLAVANYEVIGRLLGAKKR